MTNIEVRAYNAFCGTTSCRPDNKIYRFCKNCQHDSRKDAYIKGATEQRNIDIDKTCEWLREYAMANRRTLGYGDLIVEFRKAMEEDV